MMLSTNPSTTPALAIPTDAQLAWQRTETNIFIHFGLNTFAGREWGEGKDSPSVFNPTSLDCRQWASVAKAGGFKIAILTAKHHDGFCLWPSKLTTYSVASSPWKNGQGDLVREFVDAFRAEGIKVGLYLSPWDRHEACYGDSPRYNDYYCAQLTELLTNYGELHEVWFDGACAEGPGGRRQEYDWARFFGIVKTLQPGAVTFGDGGTDVRWIGNERGFAGETCWSTVDPSHVRFPGDSGICKANDATASEEFARLLNEGDASSLDQPRAWRPGECDVSIRPGWFYHAAEDQQVRSAGNLVDLYFWSVGRNSLLLLNLPPTQEGLIHSADVDAVVAFRSVVDCIFATNLAQGAEVAAQGQEAGCLVDGSAETHWEATTSAAPVEIEIRLAPSAEIGVICLQEAVQFGQRIAAWRVEAATPRGDWKLITRGTTIGMKRLLRVPAFETTRLRLVIESSVLPPVLANIGLYPATL